MAAIKITRFPPLPLSSLRPAQLAVLSALFSPDLTHPSVYCTPVVHAQRVDEGKAFTQSIGNLYSLTSHAPHLKRMGVWWTAVHTVVPVSEISAATLQSASTDLPVLSCAYNTG